jgi:hypothetical protein
MRKKQVQKTNWQLVGYFAVDSGQCVIGDPCHLTDFLAGDWKDICATFSHTQDAEQLRDADGLKFGVRVETGIGDGIYPVYATRVRDSMGYIRIAAVHIEFMR